MVLTMTIGPTAGLDALANGPGGRLSGSFSITTATARKIWAGPHEGGLRGPRDLGRCSCRRRANSW